MCEYLLRKVKQFFILLLLILLADMEMDHWPYDSVYLRETGEVLALTAKSGYYKGKSSGGLLPVWICLPKPVVLSTG